MYGCENWTIKKAERRRIDAFKLWCWRRLLRVPWTARRSDQSILKEIYPEYSLKGLMLKLKLQYFGYLMQRADSLEKTLMLGKTLGKRRRGDRGGDGLLTITDSMDVILSKLWEIRLEPGVLQSKGLQRVGQRMNKFILLGFTASARQMIWYWKLWCRLEWPEIKAQGSPLESSSPSLSPASSLSSQRQTRPLSWSQSSHANISKGKSSTRLPSPAPRWARSTGKLLTASLLGMGNHS